MSKQTLTMLVSIPNWCDQKTPEQCQKTMRMLILFLFQTGAIRSDSMIQSITNHQKKFLFQTGAIRSSVNAHCRNDWGTVSIPNWCDQKFKALDDEIRGQLQFLFQTGAIRSQNHRLRLVRRCLVSIPNWCDQKAHHNQSLLDTFSVSIPNWCDQKVFGLSPVGAFEMVSIPNWCDQKAITPPILPGISSTFLFQTGAIRRWETHCLSPLLNSVSIPNWCDQKFSQILTDLPTPMFLFQTGAIRSILSHLKQSLVSVSFYSKLVRLEVQKKFYTKPV